eukprot:1003017-Alexandrium_andersonii.AAC.1
MVIAAIASRPMHLAVDNASVVRMHERIVRALNSGQRPKVACVPNNDFWNWWISMLRARSRQR